MSCSPERRKANRENARRSTGPRTEAGKARSRANHVIHGLTGEGVALPIEDAAEVDRRFRALGDDLRPSGERGRILAHRAAYLAVRLDRCARYETATLAEAIRSAEADFDDRRREEVERAIAGFAEEPGVSVRRLCRIPEGVDWLLGAWDDLGRDLAAGIWGFDHVKRAESLLGRKTDDVGNSAVNALSAAMYGDFRLVDPPEVPRPTDPDILQARQDSARADLAALVEAEVGRLRQVRAALPLEAIARGRAEAPLRGFAH